jgi:WD40 repeat protein
VFGKAVAFSPDRDMVVTGYGKGDLAIWNLSSGEQLSIFKGHEDIVSAGSTLNIASIYFLPDGTGFITLGADGFIKLWGIR